MQIEEEEIDQFKDYSFLQYLIKPSLLDQYVIKFIIYINEQLNKYKSFTSKIQSLWFNFLDHILSLIPKDQNSRLILSNDLFIGHSKISKLFQLLLKISNYYYPNLKQLDELQLQPEFVKIYLTAFINQQTNLSNQIKLTFLLNQFNLLTLLNIYYQSSDFIPSSICNVQQIIEEIQQFSEDLLIEHAESLIQFLYLGVQYYFIKNSSEELKNTLQILLKIRAKVPNLKDLQYYDEENIQSLLQIQNENDGNMLSPITDDEKEKDKMEREKPQTKLFENEEQTLYFEKSLIQTSMTHFSSALIDYAIQMGNNQAAKEMCQQYNSSVNNSSVIGKVILEIYYYDMYKIKNYKELESFFNQSLQAIITNQVTNVIEYKVLAQLIVAKTEQIKYHFEKQRDDQKLWDIMRSLLFGILKKLFPNDVFNVDNVSIEIALDNFNQKANNLTPQDDPFLEFFISSIHVQLYLALGFIYYRHLLIIKQKKESKIENNNEISQVLKFIEKILKKLEDEYQFDILRDFIENICAKLYLDTLQAIFIKEKQQSLNQFNSVLSIFNEIYCDYKCSLKDEYKSFFVILSFRREKQLLQYAFSQIKCSIDHIEFRYSKMYKKQTLFYYKEKQYQKSLKKAVKYFGAYLTQPQLQKQIYLAEESVIFDMYQCFFQLQQLPQSLIMSQFISEQRNIKNEVAIMINQVSELTSDISSFFFDALLIQKLAASLDKKHEKESLKLLVQRIDDYDTLQSLDPELKINVKEKYLNRFVLYLRKIYFFQQFV